MKVDQNSRECLVINQSGPQQTRSAVASCVVGVAVMLAAVFFGSPVTSVVWFSFGLLCFLDGLWQAVFRKDVMLELDRQNDQLRLEWTGHRRRVSKQVPLCDVDCVLPLERMTDGDGGATAHLVFLMKNGDRLQVTPLRLEHTNLGKVRGVIEGWLDSYQYEP